MRAAGKLSNVDDIILVFKHSSIIAMYIKVVWSAEDGHDTRKPGSWRPPIHAVSSILGLVCANDREQVVLLEKGARRRIGKEVGATSKAVVDKMV